MLLLANENFPGPAVAALRAAGHDVLWARTDLAGQSDEAILSRAQTEGRVVLTFDKDFGDLAFRWGLPAACGVILFRISMVSPEAVAQRAVAELAARTDWLGKFGVIEEHRVRIRPLPPARGQ
jgi:predicted nuclease of predicted toxin-antitoxin system